MKTGRLEAFSDGVLAIVITIMVLEMKVPQSATWNALKPILPKFISYLLSFIYIGIYWNNHHHMFQAIQKVNGKVLWANSFLLFTLSLIPFTTGWMGENHFQNNTVILYGINLFLCAIAYTILEKYAVRFEGHTSVIGKALESRQKEYSSIALYIGGILFSIKFPYIGLFAYIIVAIIWLIPDKRIEKSLN